MAHTNIGPPVAGAYLALPVYFQTMADSEAVLKVIKLPAGMKVVVVGVTQDASTATLATVEVGTVADANGLVESVALAAVASELTMDGVLIESATGRAEITATAAGDIAVTATTGASTGALVDGVVTVWVYVSAHPTNTPGRASTLDVFRKATAGY